MDVLSVCLSVADAVAVGVVDMWHPALESSGGKMSVPQQDEEWMGGNPYV